MERDYSVLPLSELEQQLQVKQRELREAEGADGNEQSVYQLYQEVKTIQIQITLRKSEVGSVR